MKLFLTILRWILGVSMCLISIGGFSNGDIILAIIVLAIGIFILPPVTKILFKRKRPDSKTPSYQSQPILTAVRPEAIPPESQNRQTKVSKPELQPIQKEPTETTANQQSKRFESQISQIQFPDRIDTMVWHIKAIEKALSSGDLNLANLSYAKLIESIRQQNITEKGKYDDSLKMIQEEYEKFRLTYSMEYPPKFLPPTQKKKPLTQDVQYSNVSLVINSGSNFKLTLYNSSNEVLQKVKKILADENLWDKEKALMPLFTQYNIKCREIEDYIKKYKPIYLAKIDELKRNSSEYQNASEMDKEDIEVEIFEQAANLLYERASCDIDLVFSAESIDLTMDDELIQSYGYETIAKYIRYTYNLEKVHIDYERKDFEDLIKCGLAFSGEEIPLDEILKQQPLKTLNSIANKEGFFKRRDKAIEFILADDNLKRGIGKYIAMRRIFKLKPLPEKFENRNLSDLKKTWEFEKEYIKLIVDTYRNSQQYTEEIKGDISWVRGFHIENFEDSNSNFVCLRAREECRKKYSKTNPPKLPFHVGCNCNLQTDV